MSRLKQGSIMLALAVSMIGAFEGRRLTAYLDGGGVPTICDGATRGVKLGDVATAAQCDARFRADLLEHETAMRACLKAPDRLPDGAYLAFLDLAFNAGGPAFCGSTLVRLANAGNVRAACDQLPRWVRDNGRVVPGLVKRRKSAREVCLVDLK